MWSNDYDTNQMGATTTPPMQSGNLLSPQQRQQMNQYANSLMTPQNGPPANSLGGGLGMLGRSLIGGYLANQASSHPVNIFSGLFGGGTS